MDDLIALQSIGGHVFPNFEMLDAQTCVCVEEDHLQSVLQKEYQCGIAKRSSTRQNLRGRDIAHMIYEHVRATGAPEAALDLSDFFTVSLQGGDIQIFDTRWDQALVPTSEIPKKIVLGSLCKMRIRESVCSATDRVSNV